MQTRTLTVPQPYRIGDLVERNPASPYASLLPRGYAVVVWVGYRGLSLQIEFQHGRKWDVQVDAVKRVEVQDQ
jgi:hypothetical protein